MKKIRRISSILFVNSIFLAILPILIFGPVSVIVVSSNIYRVTSEKNNALARSILVNVSLYLENGFRTLDHTMDFLETTDFPAETVQERLDSLCLEFHDFNKLLIIDDGGIVRFVTPYNEDFLFIDSGRRDFFKENRGPGGKYVSRTFISIQTGVPTIALSVKGRDYTAVGYLDLNEFRRRFDFGPISRRGYILIVDGNGTIVAHKNYMYAEEQQNIGGIGFVEKVRENGGKPFDFRFMGERWLVSAVIHLKTGWVIGIVQPYGEAFRSLLHIVLVLLIFVLCAAVFALISAVTTVRRIDAPLNRLVQLSRSIAQGKYETSYSSSGIEEFNNLFRVFVIMSEEIALREKLLQQAKEEYGELINNVNSIIIKWNNKGEYTFINRYAEEYFGFTSDELLGKSLIGNTIPEKDSAGKTLADLPMEIIEHPELYVSNENEILKKNGERVWVQWSNSPLYDDRGKVSEILSVGTDRTERWKMEEELARSLKEKEILLREIHHRVKNNMQIISSLLNLQAFGIADDKTADFLRESQNRVYSMSLVHELLYQSEFLSRIHFRDYIWDLLRYLRDSYTRPGMSVDFDVKAEDIYLSIETAIPCALIINELISNAMKYAFPGTGKGMVYVSMEIEGSEYRLTVRDDGCGFDNTAGGFNSETRTGFRTMGLQLVYSLAQQLRGGITIESRRPPFTSGTRAVLTFPVPFE